MIDYSNVKVIGFDLDQTLYPKSPLIDAAIQQYIFEKIAAHKNCSVEEAKMMFNRYYPQLSGRKTLLQLGIPNAANVVQEALENADIYEFLTPNPQLKQLLVDLKTKYGSLSLITGSVEHVAKKKLQQLELPLDLFDFCRFGNVSKSDGTAYKEWLKTVQAKDASLTPSSFCYIGDRVSTDVDVPEQLGMRSILVNISSEKEEVMGRNVAQCKDVLEISQLLLL